jgi:hypothetical protein
MSVVRGKNDTKIMINENKEGDMNEMKKKINKMEK